MNNLYIYQNKYYEISSGFITLSIVALISVIIPATVFVTYGLSHTASKFTKRISGIILILSLLVAFINFFSENESFETMMFFTYVMWGFIFYGVLLLSFFTRLIIKLLKIATE